MDCIFCKIVQGELPSNKVYENEHVYAFHDIDPQAPVHILIIPKKHIATMNDVSTEDSHLIGEISLAAQRIAEDLGFKDDGYRLINNCGKDGGQIVYHLHFHLLAGKSLGPILP